MRREEFLGTLCLAHHADGQDKVFQGILVLETVEHTTRIFRTIFGRLLHVDRVCSMLCFFFALL